MVLSMFWWSWEGWDLCGVVMCWTVSRGKVVPECESASGGYLEGDGCKAVGVC